MQLWQTVPANIDGNSGQQRWQMTMAADDNGSQGRAADYDGEGWERAVRDNGDGRVVMMAAVKMAAAEDSGGRKQQQWQQTTAADNGSEQWRQARLGSGLQRGRLGVGGEQQRH
jgi:hypothetical protein